MTQNTVSDATRHVVAYLLHDAAANVEGYINDFSEDSLKGAESMGLVILAEYSDGSREVVKADDVVPPRPELNGVEVVLPSYVDIRVNAVLDVFDALSAAVFPDIATVAAVGTESAKERDPAKRFAAAMQALRQFDTRGGDSE